MFSLFTLSDYINKRQIKVLSGKIVEVEKDKEGLSTEISVLKETNEKQALDITELRNSIEKQALEIENLKAENQKLTEDNTALKKENADLKKKLEAAEAKKQASAYTGGDKIAYLTFDDGPSFNTIKILDILRDNDIKATFFVNGRPEQKEIYKRMVSEGHTIGNHTYSHDYAAVYKTIEGFEQEKQKLDNLIFEFTGFKPVILRFPGGSNNQVSYRYGGKDFMDRLTAYEKQHGIKYFDWNVSSTDASVTTQARDVIISEVLKGAKNKKQAIILMHDSNPKTTTVQALPAIIKGLRDQGFKFSVLTPQSATVQFK